MRWMGKGLFLLLIACLVGGSAVAQTQRSSKQTTFAVAGHLYPMVNKPKQLRAFVATINVQKPDMVFILGDSALHLKEMVTFFTENLAAPVYFLPGNHELHGKDRQKYVDHVGYMERTVVAPDINFMLINSSESVDHISRFVTSVKKELNLKNPTVLLTHHRIWDDTLMSPGPYQHDKSFFFAELFPAIKGFVNYIFAGNSKRQYFRDFSVSPNFGKLNLNNAFWVDVVKGIECYSIGMGDAFPRAGFVIGKVVQGELVVRPHMISFARDATITKVEQKALQMQHAPTVKKDGKDREGPEEDFPLLSWLLFCVGLVLGSGVTFLLLLHRKD